MTFVKHICEDREQEYGKDTLGKNTNQHHLRDVPHFWRVTMTGLQWVLLGEKLNPNRRERDLVWRNLGWLH